MEVTIVVSDAATQALLNSLNPRIERALYAAMTDATSYLLRQMKTYPPQRRGSAYRRTGTLGRSWDVPPFAGRGAGLVGIVRSAGNTAPYNRLVQDRTRQARVHRGRWATAQDVTARSARQIDDMFQARIRAAIG